MAPLLRPARLELRARPLTWRAPPQANGIARRRWMIATAKRLLPVAALALLGCVVLWPELSTVFDRHAAPSGGKTEAKSGQLTDATYRGSDQQGHPYTLTATTAHELAPGQVVLANPKGDITLSGQSWMMVQSLDGTFMQHEDNLDLSNQVQLFRDDGMLLQTDAANVDLRNGAATGTAMVHVEGPFGTLDAQGFSVMDRGALIRFHGPGRMVLNARSR